MNVGQSRSFQALAFSNGTGTWNVNVKDFTDPNMPYLQLGIEGAGTSGALAVKNGTEFTVTMKLLADPTSTANGEADGVLLSTDSPDPMQASVDQYWPFVVLTTAAAADAGVKEPMHRRPFVHRRGRQPRRLHG
jgi:hypothetical protein